MDINYSGTLTAEKQKWPRLKLKIKEWINIPMFIDVIEHDTVD